MILCQYVCKTSGVISAELQSDCKVIGNERSASYEETNIKNIIEYIERIEIK